MKKIRKTTVQPYVLLTKSARSQIRRFKREMRGYYGRTVRGHALAGVAAIRGKTEVQSYPQPASSGGK